MGHFEGENGDWSRATRGGDTARRAAPSAARSAEHRTILPDGTIVRVVRDVTCGNR
jgi:hypothetical protein